jgi:hypothetical protein
MVQRLDTLADVYSHYEATEEDPELSNVLEAIAFHADTVRKQVTPASHDETAEAAKGFVQAIRQREVVELALLKTEVRSELKKAIEAVEYSYESDPATQEVSTQAYSAATTVHGIAAKSPSLTMLPPTCGGLAT